MTREAVVVLHDPAATQARRCIRAFHNGWGLPTVCLWTDDAVRRRDAWAHPVLRSDAVAEHVGAETADVDATAAWLDAHYDVRAVVPWQEPTVGPAGALAAALGLSWAQPDVLGLFRDKYALKAHLRAVPGGPRVNVSAAVATVEEVQAVVSAHDLDRYVLKPRDGYGNTGVTFLDKNSDPALLRAALAAAGPSGLLLEDFIDGEEYYVNGQLDAVGRATVTRVARYLRGEVNGKANVELGVRLVRTTDPVFASLRDYAVEVTQATGLVRSPFHLEAKVDWQGPCLIEVGARIMGGDPADEEGRVHNGGLDIFAVAAHYYLTDEDLGPLPLDWGRYDRFAFGRAIGVSRTSGRIKELSGVREVEAMPEFVRWSIRPAVGDPLAPTVDIGAVPWNVTLEAPTDEALEEAAAKARSLLRWNDRATGLRRAVLGLVALLPGARRRLLRVRYERATRPRRHVPAAPSPLTPSGAPAGR